MTTPSHPLDLTLVILPFEISIELDDGQMICLHIQTTLERWKNTTNLGVLFGNG
jgi:hypothetical protein